MLKIKSVIYSILLILSISLSAISGVFAAWNTTADSSVDVKYTVPLYMDGPTTFKNNINTLAGSTTITKIVFDYYTEENIAIIENATGSVSLGQNGLDTIMAYAVPNDSGNTIYILSSSLIYAGSSCDGMFNGFTSVKTIEFNNFDTRDTTNMNGMFLRCSALTTIDLSRFKTNKVTSIYQMFRGCSSLTSIDISHFEFDNVLKDSRAVFDGCNAITSIKLPKKVMRFSGTIRLWFMDCHNLTTIDISCFDITNVTETQYMFTRCSKLKTIYVGSGWSTAKVTNSTSMFTSCSSLVGGNGTKYNSSYVDAAYARVDTPETPGYLTLAN